MAFIKQPSASQESESPTTFTSPQDLLDFAKSKTIQTNPLDIVALLETLVSMSGMSRLKTAYLEC